MCICIVVIITILYILLFVYTCICIYLCVQNIYILYVFNVAIEKNTKPSQLFAYQLGIVSGTLIVQIAPIGVANMIRFYHMC